jgi:glycosyltransferase involved in cell wall biosynthesis
MDILFVCSKDSKGNENTHYIHEEWLSDLDYDKIFVNKNKLPGLLSDSFLGNYKSSIDFNNNKNKKYDCLVIESPAGIYVASKLSKEYPLAKTAYINSNYRFWPELSLPYFNKNNLKSLLFRQERKIDEKLLTKNLSIHIDYIISVSQFSDQKLDQKINYEKNSIESFIIEPHIGKNRFEKISDIKLSNLDKKQVLFIGQNRHHKGIDILMDSWDDIVEDNPKAKLHIVGTDHPEYTNKNVINYGYVENEKLYNIMSESSLYLHTARFDNFPVSTLEAMRAGLPTIVSERTGTKSLVSQIDDNLVVELDPENISSQVSDYFQRDLSNKKQLSSRFKSKLKKYNIKNKKKEFENIIKNIVSKS